MKKKSRPSTMTQFYHTQGSRRPKVIEERLALIEKAIQHQDAKLFTHSQERAPASLRSSSPSL